MDQLININVFLNALNLRVQAKKIIVYKGSDYRVWPNQSF